MSRHRRLVHFVLREDAIETVKKMNTSQKKWIYMWDEMNTSHRLHETHVILYKIPNVGDREETK